MRKYFIGLDEDPSILLFDRTRPIPLAGLAYKVVSASSSSFQPNFLESHRILNMVAGAFEDGAIRLFDPLVPACVSSAMKAHNAPVNALAWSERDLELVSGAEDGLLHLWDIRMLERERPLSVLSRGEGVRTIAFNRDDKFMVTGKPI